jgi:flagellar biogenesis protein FliO
MTGVGIGKQTGNAPAVEGWAGWLLKKVRGAQRRRARLELLERITLAPRQSLVLVEADGRRFLVASSTEGSPSFYPLDGARSSTLAGTRRTARISW